MRILKRIKRYIALFANSFVVHLIPSRKVQHISIEEAESNLSKHSPDPGTSPLWENKTQMQDYDLSIIVPVYNVERYLDRCMQSILGQKTTYRYQIIAVNDGSTDQSGTLLNRYDAYEHVTILTQDNKGLSGARNTGLRIARGRYVMFVDSDDYLTETAVQSLLDAAYEGNADLIQGGYYDIDGKTEAILKSTQYKDAFSVPPNGCVTGMAWGKVYKAYLFEKICFPEKYWFEDTIVTALLTHLANRVATVSDMVYFYRQNNAGITRTSIGKPKSVDAFYVQRCVLNARQTLGMKTDKAFYEHLLKMVVLCYQRTANEPESVKKSMFVLIQDMLKTARGTNTFTVGKRYRNLEKAVVQGEYGKYCLICKFGLN